MKRYSPSIRNNNKIKEEVIAELNALVYKLSRGKHNKRLSPETVESNVKSLKQETEGLENSVGTGKEDIVKIANNVLKKVNAVKKQMQQNLSVRLEEAVDDLAIEIGMMKDVINGDAMDYQYDEIQKEKKLSFSSRKLHEKLNELRNIKEECSIQERRLDNDITKVDKEVEELESRMLEEEKEREINDLYRRISSAKKKAETLNARKSNYSVCYSFMDMIEANVNEILLSSEYSGTELTKAKMLLNMSKIREAIANPEQVIPILKLLQQDIQSINEKVKSIDKRIFEITDTKQNVNEEALNYKKQLMQKKREKQMLKEDKVKLEKVAEQEDKKAETVVSKKEN